MELHCKATENDDNDCSTMRFTPFGSIGELHCRAWKRSHCAAQHVQLGLVEPRGPGIQFKSGSNRGKASAGILSLSSPWLRPFSTRFTCCRVFNW